MFIDPPFRKDLIANITKNLEQNSWLTDNAVVYVETESELGFPPVPNNWELLKEKIAGQVAYRLFKRTAN